MTPAERQQKFRRTNPVAVKAIHDRYRATPKGRAMVVAKAARWDKSDKGKAANARYRNGTRERLDTLKLRAGCTDCGYNAHPQALHFDHIPGRGEKLFNIGAYVHCSWEKIEAEIAKCEVVCANCHAVRTHTRRIAGQ